MIQRVLRIQRDYPSDWMFRVQFFYYHYYLVWTSGLLPHQESQPELFILVGRLSPSQKSWPGPFILSHSAFLYAKGAVYFLFNIPTRMAEAVHPCGYDVNPHWMVPLLPLAYQGLEVGWPGVVLELYSGLYA